MPNLDVLFFFYFNPRSLTGARPQKGPAVDLPLFQSTLPYGSESTLWSVYRLSPYFNPRSLTGANKCTTGTKSGAVFQSTLPYGSDSSTTITIDSAVNFNPRSLTGAIVLDCI